MERDGQRNPCCQCNLMMIKQLTLLILLYFTSLLYIYIYIYIYDKITLKNFRYKQINYNSQFLWFHNFLYHYICYYILYYILYINRHIDTHIYIRCHGIALHTKIFFFWRVWSKSVRNMVETQFNTGHKIYCSCFNWRSSEGLGWVGFLL